MFLIDISSPMIILQLVTITVLLIVLGRINKKAFWPAISLFGFLALLIVHITQYLSSDMIVTTAMKEVLTKSMTIDFVFILISFISYLWIDDVETKFRKKKSVDNSLNWFWSKV
ncbi:MAG: hypothetical protein IKT41_05740 [Clostridia bacterium]|nr:hypothetical protein [Clostridia bacterium]